MLTVVGSIITPALVASIFSLLFNARAEKRKFVRESLKDSFVEARDVIGKAVAASSIYFSKPYKGRTPEVEALVWIHEKEMRFLLSNILERSDESLAYELEKVQNHFDELVSELTGGNFQQKNSKSDLSQVRKISGIASHLRSVLATLYHAQLKSSLDRDMLDRLFNYLTVQKGISALDIKKESQSSTP